MVGRIAASRQERGGEMAGEVLQEMRGFDFEGAHFGVKEWRASASGARKGGLSVAPIVFVHGFAQQASTWDDTARLLADAGAECFGFELAGHGKSACLAGGSLAERPGFFDLRFQARALLAFCDAIARDAGAAPALVGYSMGGRVALQAACLVAGGLQAGCGASMPEGSVPFSALVLESAGLGPADDAEREALRERNFAWAQRVRHEGVPAFMDWWAGLPLFESQRKLAEDKRARLRAGRLANDAGALALTFDRAGAHAMPPRQEAVRALRELPRCGIPVSYLVGESDAKYRKASDALHAETGGTVSCAVVPGAGHNIHFEQPHVFVSTFARELTKSGIFVGKQAPLARTP